MRPSFSHLVRSALVLLLGLALPAWAQLTKLTDVEAAYQREVQEKVEKPQVAMRQRLLESYRAWLDSAFKAAAAQGSLDETLALQKESKRFAAENDLPTQDEPGLSPAIVKARAAVRGEMERAQRARGALLLPLANAHLAQLRQLEKDFTRALQIEEAQSVRAQVEKAQQEIALLQPAATPAPVRVAAATPAPRPPFAAMVRPAERVDLYGSGNNSSVVYVNGKEVIKGINRDNFKTVRIGLKEGDIIAVRNAGRFSDNFFWLSFVASTGEFLFETSEAWKSYVPKSQEKWWETKTAVREQPVTFYPKGEYVGLVHKAAAKTPHFKGTAPIHNNIRDEADGGPSYAYYVVTKADLLPKKAEPPPPAP